MYRFIFVTLLPGTTSTIDILYICVYIYIYLRYISRRKFGVSKEINYNYLNRTAKRARIYAKLSLFFLFFFPNYIVRTVPFCRLIDKNLRYAQRTKMKHKERNMYIYIHESERVLWMHNMHARKCVYVCICTCVCITWRVYVCMYETHRIDVLGVELRYLEYMTKAIVLHL